MQSEGQDWLPIIERALQSIPSTRNSDELEATVIEIEAAASLVESIEQQGINPETLLLTAIMILDEKRKENAHAITGYC